MFFEKIRNISLNINNMVLFRNFSIGSTDNEKVRIKALVTKIVPKVGNTGSSNVTTKCVPFLKKVRVSDSIWLKGLLPNTKKVIIKKTVIQPVKVRTVRLVKRVRKVMVKHKVIIKKTLKPEIRKKIIKRKVLIRRKVVKPKKLKKPKKPKLIPLGWMPKFYKLKKTKRISAIGISYKQNRRLLHKPWLKNKPWLKKKKKGPNPPLAPGKRKQAVVNFHIKKRNWRRPDGRKIDRRRFMYRWKDVFLKRNKNRNKKRVFLFYNRKRNNTFITLTDRRGRVFVSQSAGYCKIKSKKKKRSPDTLKSIAYSVARAARLKNIRYIYKMFSRNRHVKSRRSIYEEFRKVGLRILVNVVVKSRTHGLPLRKKKLKRL